MIFSKIEYTRHIFNVEIRGYMLRYGIKIIWIY